MGNSRQDGSELRIVVQYVHGDPNSPWHLVAYGGDHAFRPRCFRSIEELLVVLRSAAPDFDPSQLAIKGDAGQSYIAWAGDILLNQSQLSFLGLKSERAPKA